MLQAPSPRRDAEHTRRVTQEERVRTLRREVGRLGVAPQRGPPRHLPPAAERRLRNLCNSDSPSARRLKAEAAGGRLGV
jgi:hypothetical protein